MLQQEHMYTAFFRVALTLCWHVFECFTVYFNLRAYIWYCIRQLLLLQIHLPSWWKKSGIPLSIIPGITYHHHFGSRKYSKRRRSSERYFSFTGVCVGQIPFLSFWLVVKYCRTCSIVAGAVIKVKSPVPDLQMAPENLESAFPVLGRFGITWSSLDSWRTLSSLV